MNILKKINRILNEGFEEGDMIKVTGNVSGKGSIGKVIDISPQGSFYIIKIGAKNHSYHESDLSLKKKINESFNVGDPVKIIHGAKKGKIGKIVELQPKYRSGFHSTPGVPTDSFYVKIGNEKILYHESELESRDKPYR